MKSSSSVSSSTAVIPSSRAPRPVAAASSSPGARSRPAPVICARCSSIPAHISTSRPADCRARPRSITQPSPPTRSGLARAGRLTPRRRATGMAVRPYKVTVATMTTNVTGRIFAAPPMPLATRPAAKVEAVAAATMPRGAIQPMKPRSPPLRSVRKVAANAASGLAARTSTATRASVGSSRWRNDCGVTVAEIEMNRMPIISCTNVSKNGRRAGMSNPRRFARASPMKIAAMSPVSARSASQAAATAITVASCPVVPRISPTPSLRSSSQSSSVPTSPPARPTATLSRNCPS